MTDGASALLSVEGLQKYFPIRRRLLGQGHGAVKAVDRVDLTVGRGEVVGLVGESGSGKSTLGRLLLRLLMPTAGRVVFDGTDLTSLDERRFKPFRRRMQFIFQDPFGSLDPRMRAEDIVGEGLTVHGVGTASERRDRVAALFRQVGLSANQMRRFPHQFSGGQRQRLGIARALAVEPEFVVADEPVSALDVSIQAQVLNLIGDIQAARSLAMLFIAHDLSVVQYLSDRVVVMYLGKVMEVGPVTQIYARPRHPYTEALLSAAPSLDKAERKKRILLPGDIPSPSNPPSGCVFRSRCPYAIGDCAHIEPALAEVGTGHFKACIRDDVL